MVHQQSDEWKRDDACVYNNESINFVKHLKEFFQTFVEGIWIMMSDHWKSLADKADNWQYVSSVCRPTLLVIHPWLVMNKDHTVINRGSDTDLLIGSGA